MSPMRFTCCIAPRWPSISNANGTSMRIPDEWLNNSVYLYPSEHDAYEGTRAGGSGFLLGFDSHRIAGRQMIYAVTNDQVIEGVNCTIRLNRHDGTVDVRDLDERDWVIPASN